MDSEKSQWGQCGLSTVINTALVEHVDNQGGYVCMCPGTDTGSSPSARSCYEPQVPENKVYQEKSVQITVVANQLIAC